MGTPISPKLRLDRYLAEAGLGSRSHVAALVRRGTVAVAGVIVRDPAFKLVLGEPVTANGVSVSWKASFHRLLHKPGDTVTSTVSSDGPSVLGCLPPAERERGWMPVGRLDLDTTGLLLLTTDGELAHRLTHPRWKVEKRYEALLARPVTPEDVAAFAHGLSIDGERWLPAELLPGDDPHLASVILREGRYHQVKRMFGARGNAVLRLHRAAFGPLTLPSELAPGESRELGADEEAALYRSVELHPP